jgi:murein DD-endopeptidase MepM/ murein hydrolase activator NlpD
MAKYTVAAPTKAKALAKQSGNTAAEIRRINDLTKGQTIEAGREIRLGKGFNIKDEAPAPDPAPTPRVPSLNPEDAYGDPIYQYYMNEAMGDFRSQGVQERERLSNLYTDIYGETGQLKNFDVQAMQDQRRLAAEMAARGTLRSGAYAGGERGLGTQQQKQQASQRAGIEKGYSDQTSPQALFDMGLKRGADGKVSELVQGEEVSWTDPSSKEKKTMKYDWTQTTAGRQAKQAALQQWLQKQLAGVTSVM